MLNSLETARALNVDSISMTALSTGKKGYPADLCAQKMILSAINFSALKDTGALTLIRFNNFKFADHQAFRAVFKTLMDR